MLDPSWMSHDGPGEDERDSSEEKGEFRHDRMCRARIFREHADQEDCDVGHGGGDEVRLLSRSVVRETCAGEKQEAHQGNRGIKDRSSRLVNDAAEIAGWIDAASTQVADVVTCNAVSRIERLGYEFRDEELKDRNDIQRAADPDGVVAQQGTYLMDAALPDRRGQPSPCHCYDRLRNAYPS
jgi:hypothetical protein